MSSAIFVGLTTVLGGLTQLDSMLSTYTAWSISHGDVACAYPWGSSVYFPLTAPLYPLTTAGLVVLFGVGHGVAFPLRATLGPRCLKWLAPITHWSVKAGALSPTLRFGYVGWIVLMIGAIMVLRASGRGRCGWEPLTLVALACTPPIFMCLQYLFHPQDLMAMGLILIGLALARRERWMIAGVVMGLAFTSQQFALLAIVPLAVLAPSRRRPSYIFGVIATVAVFVVPLALLTSGRALRVALVGSGLSGSQTGSFTSELHVTSPLMLGLWRMLPILAAFGVAFWAMRRLHSGALEPVPLLSIIATSLSFRLVFDEGLYGYYFMAVAVCLVLLDVLNRKFRIQLIGWLAMVVLVFDPLPWGYNHLTNSLHMWIWQLILIPPAVALAVSPLAKLIAAQRPTASVAKSEIG